MNIKIDKDTLLTKVTRLAKILPKKPVLPSQESILFEVEQSVLYITVVTETISVKTHMMCNADGDLAFGLNAKMLIGTIDSLLEPTVDITISHEGEAYMASIVTLTGQYGMEALTKSDFFDIAVTDNHLHFTASAKMLKECMGGAKRFAMAEFDLRNLHGIHMMLDPNNSGNLIIEATDAAKVCRSSFTLDSVLAWEPVIVTVDFADALHALLDDISIVTMSTDKLRITAKTDQYEISNVLIDGKFVNVSQFFEMLPPHFITLNRNEIESALKRILMYAPAEVKNPIMVLEIIDDKLHLYSQDVMRNSSGCETITLPTKYDHVRTGFNIKFLLDIVKSFNTDSCSMYFERGDRAFFVFPLYAEMNFVNSSFFIAPVFIEETVLEDAKAKKKKK